MPEDVCAVMRHVANFGALCPSGRRNGGKGPQSGVGHCAYTYPPVTVDEEETHFRLHTIAIASPRAVYAHHST